MVLVTKTDMCNKFLMISLWLRNPDLSAEEKEYLQLGLQLHLNEANTQRRGMNAYIILMKRKFAPDDPSET